MIKAGLASAGLTAGTPDYDTFMAVAQIALDPADPVVLGAKAAATHPLHVIEVLGDQVIPNRVANAPLSGTEVLASVMPLRSITTTTAGEDGMVRFNSGVHGSLLDSTSSFAATVETQRQVAAFQLARGTAISIGDSSVIAPATP